MLTYLRQRWQAEGGYREFLILAFPLILSTASWSVQHFINRIFLAWYSTEALAAALPAGMTSFIFLSFFLGIAQYTQHLSGRLSDPIIVVLERQQNGRDGFLPDD